MLQKFFQRNFPTATMLMSAQAFNKWQQETTGRGHGNISTGSPRFFDNAASSIEACRSGVSHPATQAQPDRKRAQRDESTANSSAGKRARHDNLTILSEVASQAAYAQTDDQQEPSSGPSV